ncbi:restriction endonuclease subunit S [Halpernia sp.]|uniref:restriction endonuclease subunit S n=1 Tax=Halpernia sp. TaxID=2782209 RepID=UPI003A8C93F0
MKLGYKKLGDYIRLVDERNRNLEVETLLGLSMRKEFRKSTSNVVGTDMANYKIVRKDRFACDFMSVIRVFKLPVVLQTKDEAILVSPAYSVFEVIDKNALMPEYLMLWFRRSEFDRYCFFKCDSAVRGGFNWTELCETEINIPSLDKQKEIIAEYEAIENRIQLNKKLCATLEETAQTIYKHWFEDFKDYEHLGNHVDFGPAVKIIAEKSYKFVEMANVSETSLNVKKVELKNYSGGAKFSYNDTLLARISPCLQNGKTAFVNFLNENEVGFGSTEFIVIRAKNRISPYWVYCLAKDEKFREYAISSMIGSTGRERVHSKYLEIFKIPKIDYSIMKKFDEEVKYIFVKIKNLSILSQKLEELQSLLLGKMTVEITAYNND